MFLTIGDKVRSCRTKYCLKQSAFKDYGVTQYYLSLIENNKRQPSDEMINNIYEALVELTDGNIYLDYSYADFKKSPKRQATEWLQIQYERRGSYDKELFLVAKRFNIVELLYEMYLQFGDEEQKDKNYQKSNEYYQEAIQCALQLNESPIQMYLKMASNLGMNLNQEGALAYYRLALTYATTDEEKYKIKYYIGIIKAKLGNPDMALFYADEIIHGSKNSPTIIGALLLKEYSLRKSGQFLQGREVLENYLKSSPQNEYVENIYYNLAINYMEDNLYSDALNICFDQLSKDGKNPTGIRCKVILLIATIYEKMGRYEDGITFIRAIKDDILNEKEQRFIRWYYEIYLELLMRLQLDDEIMQVLNEIKVRVNQQQINKDILIQFKSTLLKYVFKYKKFSQEGVDVIDTKKYDSPDLECSNIFL